MFFTTFDVFRRLGLQASALADGRVRVDDGMSTKSRAPTRARVAQGTILVIGGGICFQHSSCILSVADVLVQLLQE